MYFRWGINFVVIGLPMSVFIALGLVWNLWFNIAKNHFWAHGNLYLVIMTNLAFLQSLNAIFLLFEIPAYLRWTKPFRSLSVEWGFIFNVVYLAFVYRWRQCVNASQEKGVPPSGIELFEILFYMYNLVLHGPIFIVNFAIISKELTLERWQLLSNKWASHSRHG